LKLHCGRFELGLQRPLLMGVVNVTPDSFTDGGQFLNREQAVAQARRLVEAGAAIIDIGAESTRPGAAPVSEDEELGRLLPVLEDLRELAVPISIDTRRPGVMGAALAAGASMINDIEALTAPGALAVVVASDCGLCLMHKQGDPATMQHAPTYGDVVADVKAFLAERIAAVRDAGIALERIVADVGFGFGKTDAHNLTLLRRLAEFSDLAVPLLAGLSRKSTLGRITGRTVDDRLAASLAAALLAVQAGAKILRVHDVRETRDVLAVWDAVTNAPS
jgi:dihydropteroate synthase